MKHQIKTLLCICLTLLLGATTTFAQIQLEPLDNFGIFPFGTTFDPAGKFASMGESGGSCKLYGFRAQKNSGEAVNLGIQTVNSSFGFSYDTPSLVFNSFFWLVSEDSPIDDGNGCGDLLGYFGNSVLTNTVFTLYGSAIANGGTWQPSDARLKKDVNEIGNAIELVQNLRGVTYEYRTDDRPELGLNKGLQYGFITQEVEEVMPNAVRVAEDPKGEQADYQVMQYTQIIPILTEAVKEVITNQDDRLEEQSEINLQLEDKLSQQAEVINTLESRLKALEARLNGQNTPVTGVEIGDILMEGVSLRQNRPNPFQGETVIEYTIPSNMNNAQLVVYDLKGKAISSSNLNAGNGQISIRANDLSSGVYFYSIENNGETLARQKMIVK